MEQRWSSPRCYFAESFSFLRASLMPQLLPFFLMTGRSSNPGVRRSALKVVKTGWPDGEVGLCGGMPVMERYDGGPRRGCGACIW